MSVAARLTRLFTSRDDLAADEDRQQTRLEINVQECRQARRRGRIVVAGRLRSVVVQPRDNAPTLEAELYDGTGVVRLIWLGRRMIAGVEPGRFLIAEGFANQAETVPIIFNPRFELRAPPREGK